MIYLEKYVIFLKDQKKKKNSKKRLDKKEKKTSPSSIPLNKWLLAQVSNSLPTHKSTAICLASRTYKYALITELEC